MAVEMENIEDQGKTPFSITVLDSLKIASPCQMQWDDMLATEAQSRKFCQDCKKHVHDVSQMSRVEAELLLQRATVNNPDGSVCVQLYRRADGTVMTDDCPAALKRVRDIWRNISRVAASMVALIGLYGTARADETATRGRVAPSVGQPRALMGEIGPGTPPAATPATHVLGGKPVMQVSWRDQAMRNPEMKKLVERFEELEKQGATDDNKKLELAKAALDVAKCGDKNNLYIFSKPYYVKAEGFATGVSGSRNLLKDIASGKAKNAEKLGCK